jgi:hypothetical protein
VTEATKFDEGETKGKSGKKRKRAVPDKGQPFGLTLTSHASFRTRAPIPPMPPPTDCAISTHVSHRLVYRLGLAVNRYYRATYRYYRSHPEPYPPECLSWVNPCALLPESRLPNINPTENHCKELVIRLDYRFTDR